MIHPDRNLAELIDSTEVKMGYTLTPHQRHVVTLMLQDFRLMKQGRGAGKTFLLDFLRWACDE